MEKTLLEAANIVASLETANKLTSYNINEGYRLKTKKGHPCGSNEWEITRVGVDFKLKCCGCEHVIMVQREKALKMIVKKVR